MNDEKKEMAEVAEEAVEVTANEEGMATLMFDPNEPVVTIKKLMDAGVYLGHPVKRWNPKMKPYIYEQRNGVHIINLNITRDKIAEAYLALMNIVKASGKVLFVGTRNTVKKRIKDEAVRSGSFYINNRWLGGTLTNFRTISRRISYLKDLEEKDASGELDVSLSKKEAAGVRKEIAKLNANLEGLKEIKRLPQAVVVVDPLTEHNAIAEARKIGIKVFAIADTNADPDGIDYLIPANDDAEKSTDLILALLADAIVEAKEGTPVEAHTKTEGEDATMNDAISLADKENKAKLERIRAERKARQEKQEQEQKAKQERYAKKNASKVEGKTTSEEKKEVGENK